jgi:hypothetical protein
MFQAKNPCADLNGYKSTDSCQCKFKKISAVYFISGHSLCHCYISILPFYWTDGFSLEFWGSP